MAFEHNDMNGSLFKNKGKEPGDNRPDYTGDMKVFGHDVRLAAWVKDGKNGKFMSIKVSQQDEQRQSAQPTPPPVDDEIPF